MSLLTNPAAGKLILRVVLGGLLLFHGVAKIMHPASLDFISSLLSMKGLPNALVYGVYIGEIVAPLMVLFGYLSRVGGVIIFINMIFAIGLAHAAQLFQLGEHGGLAIELQLFYLLTAAAVAFLGSGRYAVKPD